MWRVALAATLASALALPVAGQTPQPFPRPGESRPPDSRPAEPRQPAPAPAGSQSGGTQPQPARAVPAVAPVQTPPAAPAPAGPIDPNAPRPDEVVFPVYPAAQFIAAYDAGRGQRYMLFGTTAAFAEIVGYYRTQLGEKGDLVFREPPTHMFEVGRFRDETMAFPPGVTVKDWTWGGSQGYPNPKPGVQPARYPTIIMIVPPPAAASQR